MNTTAIIPPLPKSGPASTVANATPEPLPFGDELFSGITDFDAAIRSTIRHTIEFMDVRKHRTAHRKPRFNDYIGGPAVWAEDQRKAAA